MLANADESPLLLHPHTAHVCQDRVSKLCENLQREENRAPAIEVLRSLAEQVTLVPDNGELAIILRGNLGATQRFALGKKNPDFLSETEALGKLLSQALLVAGVRTKRLSPDAANDCEALVAGVGFEPTTFRL